MNRAIWLPRAGRPQSISDARRDTRHGGRGEVFRAFERLLPAHGRTLRTGRSRSRCSTGGSGPGSGRDVDHAALGLVGWPDRGRHAVCVGDATGAPVGGPSPADGVLDSARRDAANGQGVSGWQRASARVRGQAPGRRRISLQAGSAVCSDRPMPGRKRSSAGTRPGKECETWSNVAHP